MQFIRFWCRLRWIQRKLCNKIFELGSARLASACECTHSHTHTLIYTHRHRQMHTQVQTHTHTHSITHTYTDTCIHRYNLTYINTRTCIHAHARTESSLHRHYLRFDYMCVCESVGVRQCSQQHAGTFSRM